MADNTFFDGRVAGANVVPLPTVNQNNHPDWKIGDIQIAVWFWDANDPSEYRRYNDVRKLLKVPDVGLAYEVKRLRVVNIIEPSAVRWPVMGLSAVERSRMAHQFELWDERGGSWFNDVRANRFPNTDAEYLFYSYGPNHTDTIDGKHPDPLDERPYHIRLGMPCPLMTIEQAIQELEYGGSADCRFRRWDTSDRYTEQFSDIAQELETLKRIHQGRQRF